MHWTPSILCSHKKVDYFLAHGIDLVVLVGIDFIDHWNKFAFLKASAKESHKILVMKKQLHLEK